MNIEVLHIDDCGNWRTAGDLLTDVLRELNLPDVSPRYVLIDTPGDAAHLAFAGSPTILIDGVDIVEDAQPTTDLACRLYRNSDGYAGVPSRATIREAIISRLPKEAVRKGGA